MARPIHVQPRDRANLVAISSLGSDLATVRDAAEARAITVSRCAQLLDADVTLWWSEERRYGKLPAIAARGADLEIAPVEPRIPTALVVQVLRHAVPRWTSPSCSMRRTASPPTG